MKNLSRISNKYTDTELGEKCRTWIYLFKERVTEFEAFDPDLNLAFAQTWLEVVEQFEGHQSDENTLDELQQYTVELERAMNRLMDKVSSLEYFVDEMYEATPYRKKEMGFVQLKRLRYSKHADMLIACAVLLAQATDLLPQLTAAGMPPTLLTQLEAAIQDAHRCMVEQERCKLYRITLTHQRIEIVNRMYQMHRTVARAAQVIYAHQPGLLVLFV